MAIFHDYGALVHKGSQRHVGLVAEWFTNLESGVVEEVIIPSIEVNTPYGILARDGEILEYGM
jgi:hypothetical protein